MPTHPESADRVFFRGPPAGVAVARKPSAQADRPDYRIRKAATWRKVIALPSRREIGAVEATLRGIFLGEARGGDRCSARAATATDRGRVIAIVVKGASGGRPAGQLPECRFRSGGACKLATRWLARTA
jgi:hypothetical protein